MLVQTPNKPTTFATRRGAPCDPSPGGSSNQFNCGFSTSPTTSGTSRPRSEQRLHSANVRNDGSNAQGHETVIKTEHNVEERQSLVFNYSDTVLTDEMVSLLDKGLNFSVLQSKLDITQVLADFKYFERSIIWHEFHHGNDP